MQKKKNELKRKGQNKSKKMIKQVKNCLTKLNRDKLKSYK